MSKRGQLDREDVYSVARHVIVPFVAGIAAGVIEAIGQTPLSLETLRAAAGTAVLAGLLRLLHRLAKGSAERAG